MTSLATALQLEHSDAHPDRVLRLRQWGANRLHPLPAAPTSHCSIGSAEICGVRLEGDRVAPIHAHLRREVHRWFIRALDRDVGLHLDGARCDAFALEPGAEIAVGSVTLVAESRRSAELRGFCSRLLGWGADRAVAVDLALRAIRLAATHRTVLCLRGEGDLVPVALALHRRAFGLEQPFVVCDPRRRNGRQSVRSAANRAVAAAAVHEAAGGTLCVRASRLPEGFAIVLRQLRDLRAGARLIVCAGPPDGVDLSGAAIDVPSLSDRTEDLPRIIDEYAAEAVDVLGAQAGVFTRDDRDWVIAHATSHEEIEKATLRLVALRTSPNLSRAAARLGMAQVSLARWIGRRGLSVPPRVDGHQA